MQCYLMSSIYEIKPLRLYSRVYGIISNFFLNKKNRKESTNMINILTKICNAYTFYLKIHANLLKILHMHY